MSLSTASRPASFGHSSSVSKNLLILLWAVALAAGVFYLLREVPQYFVFTQESVRQLLLAARNLPLSAHRRRPDRDRHRAVPILASHPQRLSENLQDHGTDLSRRDSFWARWGAW